MTRLARLAYVLTGDAEASDEIVQDAFLKLHDNWDRIDNPSAYLRTSVVNGCHSHHRHLAVVRRAPVDGGPADFSGRFDRRFWIAGADVLVGDRTVVDVRSYDANDRLLSTTTPG